MGRVRKLWVRGKGSRGLWVVGLVAALYASGMLRAQTLARPGWAGSGMRAERWWPNAVLCEVGPESLPAEGGSTLKRISAHLDDLQTLGVDGVLLRGMEAAPATGANGTSGAGAIVERFGSLEEFDALLSDAVRHGIRVLVELRPGAHGLSLTDEARFWLNHGVTGLALPGDDPAEIRAVRGVLRGYVGERVLIAEGVGAGAAGADLERVSLPSPARGAGEMRLAIERARAMMGARGPAPLLSAGEADGDARRVVAAALLGSGGAVLLRVDDLDLAHAGAGGDQRGMFAWYRQWSGLHRGNAVLRSGDERLLDYDAEGALVWVREARGGDGGAAPIVAICNVTDKPIRFSLVEDIQRLRLRGSFLRTVARTDGGMGAMPLREVALPAFGVYVGELSR